MIRRRDKPTIYTPQTAHGWLAGQLAAHWGNSRFHHPGDVGEMVLAAANHDQGWVQWEQAPKINAHHRPADFLEMPTAEHIAIWQKSIAYMDSQSRYGAVLVSKHARFLNEMRLTMPPEPSAETELLRVFCTEQAAWEAAALDELRGQPYYAPFCEESRLAAAFRLLQVFDWLSLLLCLDVVTESVVEDVPGVLPDERVSITLKSLAEDVLTVSPWAFDVPAFSVAVQTKQLPAETFPDDAALQAAWHATPLSFRVITFRAERV